MPYPDHGIVDAVYDKRATMTTASSSPSNLTIETDIKASTDEAIIAQSGKSSWKDLFAFTKASHAGPLTVALVSSAVSAGFKVAFAVVLGQVFDLIGDYGSGQRSGGNTMDHVTQWSLIIVGLAVGNWIANSAFLAFWITFGEIQASSARQDTFSSLLSKNMSWFDAQDQGVSSLLVRIQTQTRELQQATSQVFGLLVCDIITAVASVAVALYYSWKLTLVLLATLPVSALILSLATRKLEPAIQIQRAHLATASKHVTASLLGIDLVKIFGGYETELRHYSAAIQRSSKAFHTQAAGTSFQMGWVMFWVIALFVIGFWYGVSLIDDGLSPGNVMTTFYATLAAFQGVEALLPHWLVLAKGMSAGGFLSAVVAHARRGDKKVIRMGRTARPTVVFGNIQLTNVSFAYPSNPKNIVLSRSTMSFPAGKMTFIVGRSGSGKSTVGSLIANLYEPLTGDIQVDGNSMRILNEQWIRENITLVQQSSVLFNDSMFNNIALGHPYPERATTNDVLLACYSAMLHSTVEGLPDGLETNIGPQGHNLSGGQKQRLALARARLRDPPVLILDEVTSGLDPVTRTLVMHSIRRWRREKTTIIITHDVSQIDDEDYVYVIDSSFLVQQGFKQDLRCYYGGYFSQLMAQTLSELPATNFGGSQTPLHTEPPHINIIAPPESPESPSPITPIIPSRSARVTDYMLRELETTSYGANQIKHPYRISLALKSNLDLRQSVLQSQTLDLPRRVSSLRPISFRADGYETWDEEIHRFSRFVSQQFVLQPEAKQRSDPEASALLRKGATAKDKRKSGGAARPSVLQKRMTMLRQKLVLQVPSKSDARPPLRRSSVVFSGNDKHTQLAQTQNIPLQDVEHCQCSSRHSHDTAQGGSSTNRPIEQGPSKSQDSLQNKNDIPPFTKKPRKQISLVATLKTVWPTLGARDRLTLVLGIIASVLGAASSPVFAFCFARLLAVLTSTGDKSKEGMKWALAMLALGVINGLGWGGSRYMLERVGQAWVNSIRTEALRRILHQPKAWFGKAKNSPGRITECLDRNAEEMRNLVGKFIPIMTAVVSMVVISIIWALVVSWKLTLVALAPCPVIVGAVKGFAIISGKWEDKCNKGAEDASAAVTEIFLNIRVVKALTLEKHFTAKYEDLVARALGLGLKRAGLMSPLYGLYQSTGYFLVALVFYYGTVLLADEKELGVAEVMQVVNLLLFGIGSATGMLTSIPQLTMAQATASQMLGYASLPIDPPEEHDGTKKPQTPLPIKMDDLGFVYSRTSRSRVLNGVSLDIQQGDCTAIVGPSGCGKSTIISLILSLYHPLASRKVSPSPSGDRLRTAPPLSFGGIPSTEIDIHHLRSMMAYVPQTPYLFPTTIAENIAYGLSADSPYRLHQSIAQAAEAAGIHSWIKSLPEGYATLVGDGGQTLSGGQAQRLCIARALVRQPRLLVLDEPTSALDAESAEIIRQTIRTLRLLPRSHGRGKKRGGATDAMTIVMVTHNQEMMGVADWIVMLDESGNVMEKGGYGNLWEEKGPFWGLVSGMGKSEG